MNSLRHIILTAFTIMALMASAESYTVYSVHGNVMEYTPEGNVPINIRDTHLTDNSQIIIGKNSSLTLYLEGSKKLVSVNEYGKQRLSTLIRRNKNKSSSAVRWVKSLVASLLNSDTPENTHRKMLQSQGGSHRGDDDDKALLNAFAGFYKYGYSAGDTPVTFRLVDTSGKEISNFHDYDDAAVAEITNWSDSYMFVNIVACSSNSRELIFPVDTDIENNCCAHLCVPPFSTVTFSELSFFPSLLPVDSRLILAASPVEVNFTVLCSPELYYDSAVRSSAGFFSL